MDYIGYDEVGIAIAYRRTFIAKSMTGEVISGMPNVGKLPKEWADRLIEDAPTYMVASYGTPIAWVTKDNHAVVPGVKYSTTTGRHQNLAARAFYSDESVRSPL